MKTKLSLFVLFSFIFCLCEAQVPQGFNYQAIARDASGNPLVNQSLNIRLTIQSDSMGGTVYYQELHSSIVTNGFGLISVVLGKGSPHTGTAASFGDIDWKVTPKFIMTEIDYGSGYKNMGSSKLWSVPYAMIAGDLAGSIKKLEVKGTASGLEEALFEVKNKNGQTIFAVYNEGVRIWVDDGSKGTKGGFAVGGFDMTKATKREYLVVSDDSIRMYLDSNPLTKGKKGGFAVGGFDMTKGTIQNYLDVSDDSIRMYIDKATTKGKKGGFAVGGFDNTKGGNVYFLNVATDTNGIINPSQNRILWYPLKNAFLTGRVLIESPSNVGENSFATGYESKAKGVYSQAMGFKAIANGDYSTAIGKNAVAEKINSFSFGEEARAIGSSSYSFGRSALASADGAFAIGSQALDTTGSLHDTYTMASGKSSVAIGQGSWSTNTGAMSLGIFNTASGEYSTSIGWGSQAAGKMSVAMGVASSASNIATYGTAVGYYSTASGPYCIAIGRGAIASGWSSTAIGNSPTANGNYSVSIGYWNSSTGTASTALGNKSSASGYTSFAIGRETEARGSLSFVMGFKIISKPSHLFAFGQFNDYSICYSVDGWDLRDPIFMIGNGADDSHRSNLFTIMKNGSTSIGKSYPNTDYMLDVNGEITSRSYNAFRLRQNTYSTIIRNDNSRLYFLLTNSGDPDGIWNGLRPFYIDLTSGNVGLGNVLFVQHGGNVGINTSTPNSLFNPYMTIGDAKDISSEIMNLTIKPSGNTDFLRFFGLRKAAGSDWRDVALRIQHRVDGADMAYIEFNPSSSGRDLAFGTDNIERLRIDINGNVGIGTTTPGYKLTVNGTAWCSAGAWTGSDFRWKKNIRPLHEILPYILALQGVSFDWRTDEFPDFGFETGDQIGLIAQEVEKVLPELVRTDKSGYKAVAYDKLGVVIVEAIKEQQQQIKQQQQQIESTIHENQQLKSELQSLKEEVEQIKALQAKEGSK